MSSLSFCLLLLSILTALLRSRRVLRLYLRAQLIATVALFLFQRSHWYTVVYCCCVLLVAETNLFMLIEDNVGRDVLRGAVTFAAVLTTAALYGMTHVHSWIVLSEGFLLSALGMALLHTRYVVVGTLTLGMAWYDLMWLVSPDMRGTTWLPSVMCSVAFLWLSRRDSGAVTA